MLVDVVAQPPSGDKLGVPLCHVRRSLGRPNQQSHRMVIVLRRWGPLRDNYCASLCSDPGGSAYGFGGVVVSNQQDHQYLATFWSQAFKLSSGTTFGVHGFLVPQQNRRDHMVGWSSPGLTGHRLCLEMDLDLHLIFELKDQVQVQVHFQTQPVTS